MIVLEFCLRLLKKGGKAHLSVTMQRGMQYFFYFIVLAYCGFHLLLSPSFPNTKKRQHEFIMLLRLTI